MTRTNKMRMGVVLKRLVMDSSIPDNASLALLVSTLKKRQRKKDRAELKAIKEKGEREDKTHPLNQTTKRIWLTVKTKAAIKESARENLVFDAIVNRKTMYGKNVLNRTRNNRIG